jgi:hypothetical protein
VRGGGGEGRGWSREWGDGDGDRHWGYCFMNCFDNEGAALVGIGVASRSNRMCGIECHACEGIFSQIEEEF